MCIDIQNVLAAGILFCYTYPMNDNKLLQKGLVLEYLTLGWNILECVLVLIAGIAAGSVALIGFGIDSMLEIFANIVAIWHLKGIEKNREKMAMRLIGFAFVGVAIYIFIQSTLSFFSKAHPHPSFLGIVSLFFTCIVMFTLAGRKEKVGKQMQNHVLIAEAKVTRVDGYLSGAVLLGLVLNALFSWWWADPLAGLVIVFYGFKEGFHALRG